MAHWETESDRLFFAGMCYGVAITVGVFGVIATLAAVARLVYLSGR